MIQDNTGSQHSRIGKQSPAMKGSAQSYVHIINQIVDEAVNRTRQGIKEWRQHMEQADDPTTPRWDGLQDLYEYLSVDGHLISQINIRKGAVLSKRGFIRDSKTGKEDKDKTKLLQKKWFFDLVSIFMDAKFYKYSLVQLPEASALLNPNPLEQPFYMVPRRNFVPQKNLILFGAGQDKGVNITDPFFKGSFILVNDQDKFGLMNYIVPDLIWKKNARQAWAIFSDRFGIPLVKIETNRTNKADIDKLEAMAKLMGQAARAIIPAGSKMDIVDSATKGDPHKIFMEQANISNDEISKAILGATMISSDGASLSQSQVHERVLDQKVTGMDLISMEFTINDQLLPLLRAYGFPFNDTDEYAYDRSVSIDPDKHWTIVQGMMEKGYEVDEQWLTERFNIQITGKKETAPTPPTPPVTPTPKARKGFFE